jgi:N-acetylmuramoyl-L-alanine amidase
MVSAVVGLACDAPPPAAGDGGVDLQLQPGQGDAERAERWLKPEAPLPPRAEVVALSDRISIAAEKAAEPKERARLTHLAAQLRERLWRLDRVSTDAREAIELYRQVAQTATDDSCPADFRRATLAGEFASDARASYRELYLTKQRQAAIEGNGAARERCDARIAKSLEALAAYRPRGASWQELEREGVRIAEEQKRGDSAVDTSAAAASASGSASPARRPPPLKTGQDVIVVPDDSMITKGAAKLTAVQPYSWERGGRVVLTLDKPVRYTIGSLPPDAAAGRGHRVYLDLLGARLKGVKKQQDGSGLIRSVRLGKRKEGTRLVVDLAAAAARRVFYLPEPFRVVIDLNTRSGDAHKAVAPGGKRVVRRVALDPGHGGWDDGAVGPTGLREKDVTLDVAHRAAPALAAELGIETMLTRDTDAFIALEERTARANAFHADLFVSVHCNATENGQARGVQIFILDPTREADAVATRVAARENRAVRDKRTGPASPTELHKQLTSIAAGLDVSAVTDNSRLFASLLRRSTFSSLGQRFPGTHDHGVRTAGFFVLVGADMPSVLYETAFISNPDDEALLAKADFRQKLADSIVNAVRAYRDGKE